MNNSYVSVTAPVEQAFERMKLILFQPFDISKWFVIGFCAWLAYLGQGGASGGGGGWQGGGGNRGSSSARDALEHVNNYVLANLGWIVPVVIGAVFFGLAVWALILWLSSRGRFMFLHCVVVNRGEVKEPWLRYDKEANSLFVFRVVFTLVTLIPMLPLIFLILFLIWGMIMAEAAGGFQLLTLAGLILLLVVFGVLFWIVSRFTTDFVVPIQYARRTTAVEAWRELLRLISPRFGSFVMYLLFRIVLAIAIGAIILAAILVTCCIAGCIMAIPYLGTVVILPILVFERSYSILFFAQFGPDYDLLLDQVVPV